MGIYSGVFAFAVGAGPYPGALLAERFGLNAPFYAYAAVGSIVASVAWFRVPETREARFALDTSTTRKRGITYGARALW
jgi:predicted MFS family arabinose efflux permease